MMLIKIPLLARFNRKDVKIKLAAIAKDEAAYLPEWIHHHFYFGFDEIEIYVNNTTDNSSDILKKIKKYYPIKVVDADYIFDLESDQPFQNLAYSIILDQAIRDGFTHLMFLDIDEFWTPLGFNTTIKECLVELNDPDVLSFEWVFKCNEIEKFGRPFKLKNNVDKFQLVKTIFKTSLDIKAVYSHNVLSEEAQYLLADGSVFASKLEHKYAVNGENKFGKVKDFYILHRFYRSPVEYISMLGQGMRQAKKVGFKTKSIELKTNRDGYIDFQKQFVSIEVKKELLEKYDASYQIMLKECNLLMELEKARLSVMQRYQAVVDLIPKLDKDYSSVLHCTLANIDIPEVIIAYKKFKFKFKVWCYN